MLALEVVNISNLISLINIVICSYITVKEDRIGNPRCSLKETHIDFVGYELGSAMTRFPFMVSLSPLTRLPLEHPTDLFAPWITFQVYTKKTTEQHKLDQQTLGFPFYLVK